MEIIYRAKDGTEFETEEECQEYEAKETYNGISPNAIFVDEDFKRVSNDMFIDEYSDIYGMYIPDMETACAIKGLLKEYAYWNDRWSENYFIPGFYWFDDNEDTWVNLMQKHVEINTICTKIKNAH